MGENKTTVMGTAAARENLADLVSRVGYGRELVVLERRGRPLAALISLEDLRLFRELLEGNGVDAEDGGILSALDSALAARVEGGEGDESGEGFGGEPDGNVVPFERKP